MRRHIYLTLVAALTISMGGAAGPTDDMSTEGFLSESLIQSASATRASELALERSESKEVKQFAHKIIEQQSRFDLALVDLGWSNRVPVLVAQGKGRDMSEEALGELKGAAFDRAYLKFVIDNHERWAELVQRCAESGAELPRAWAAKMSPPLRERLREARGLLKAAR